MRYFPTLTLLAIGALVMNHNVQAADAVATDQPAATATTGVNQPATPLNKEMKTLDGKEVNPAKKYKGKVVLLVNVASKCGLTRQYEQLQALHDRYAERGLAIVGVPCNQFRSQEPGTAAEIAEFCEKTYGVEFDLLAKVDVNGESAAPLYKEITALDTKPVPAGDISWNFEKFLFNREGQVAARFAPRTQPDDPAVLGAIEAELAKKE